MATTLTEQVEATTRSSVLRSPLFPFCAWIAAGLLLCQLKWSVLFRDTRVDTWLVLGIGFCVFFVLAHSHARVTGKGTVPVNLWAVALVTAYFGSAYAANGGIPVVQIVHGEYYDVYGFGIDGLHVLMLSLAGFIGVRAFRTYLDSRSRVHLLSYLWIVVLIGSIASRSALSFLLFASVVLFLRNRRVRMRTVAVSVAALMFFLVLFGQFGDARLAHQIQQETGQSVSSGAIADVSGASDEFDDTGLPAYWLWSYMYMASPIANLNEALAYSDGALCGDRCDLVGLVVYELVPDVAGDRVGQLLGVEEFDKSAFLIAPDITASTTFGSAVGYAGIVGALAVLLSLVAVSVFAMRAFAESEVSEEGIALLATVLFFSFFENMLAYSPLFLQLALALARTRWRLRLL